MVRSEDVPDQGLREFECKLPQLRCIPRRLYSMSHIHSALPSSPVQAMHASVRRNGYRFRLVLPLFRSPLFMRSTLISRSPDPSLSPPSTLMGLRYIQRGGSISSSIADANLALFSLPASLRFLMLSFFWRPFHRHRVCS